MTQPPTYNAFIHFAVPICDGHLAENPITGEHQTAQQWMAFKKERAAREWLTDNGYPAPLIVHNNCDPLSERGEIVVVMEDKNSALMLKLAMT